MKTGRKRKRKPDSVDINAGAILFALRSWRGLSQEKLATEIDVTFQQIQKYERGLNRMSASTLYRLSRVLDVSVIEFFAGLDGVLPDTKHLWLSKDEIQFLKTYRSIQEGAARRHALNLIKTVASYRLDGD